MEEMEGGKNFALVHDHVRSFGTNLGGNIKDKKPRAQVEKTHTQNTQKHTYKLRPDKMGTSSYP